MKPIRSKGSNLYTHSQQMFEETGFSPKIKMTITQMFTCYRLADNGLGPQLHRICSCPYSASGFSAHVKETVLFT